MKTSSETVACFDYYKFGSAQAEIETEFSKTFSGSSLAFVGTLKNDNAYPLVDASVYVKIFRRQSDTDSWMVNGHHLVDQFFVVEDIDLPANGTEPFSFEWNVPSYARSGEYFATTYVMTQKKFNFSGLSFTNDVNGNSVDFTVVGEQANGVTLDPNAVTIAGEKSNLAAFVVQTGSTEAVPVQAMLRNTTAEVQEIPLIWTAYKWDGINDENQLERKVEVVSLAAGQSKPVSFSVSDTSSPVYYVVVEAVYRDTKSMLNIRFAREGVERPRINFPGVTAYPLEAGKTSTVFSCFHNSGLGDSVPDGRMTLAVKDASGKVVDLYEYRGNIPGNMTAVKHDFVPGRTLGTFTVEAKLYQGDTLADESTTTYDCATLGGPCEGASSVSSILKQASPGKIAWTILIAGVILVLVWKVARSRKSGRGRRMKVWLVGIFLGTTIFFGATVSAEAKSVTITASGPVTNNDPACFDASVESLIEYRAMASSGQEHNPSRVNVGDQVTFTASLGEISWFASGKIYDSPYGYWNEGASRDDKYHDFSVLKFTGPNCTAAYGYVFGALAVDPPFGNRVEFSHDWSTAMLTDCETEFSYGKDPGALIAVETCSAGSVGTIETQVRFLPTFSRFYLSSDPTKYKSLTGATRYEYAEGRVSLSGIAVGGETGNRPPEAPVVDGPRIGDTAHSYEFGATSTDPDGDDIRYGFDWDRDGAVDEWSPAPDTARKSRSTGTFEPIYVHSGERSAALERRFTTLGIKPFQVLAEDMHGSQSDFTFYSIDIQRTITPTLKVCRNSCVSGGQAVGTLDMRSGDTQNLVACCNVSQYTCNMPNDRSLLSRQDMEAVFDWSWASASPPGSFSPNLTSLDQSTILSASQSGSSDRATVLSGIMRSPRSRSGGSEKVFDPGTAFLGGVCQSASFDVRVSDSPNPPPPPPPAGCSCDTSVAPNYCIGTTYDDSCGNSVCSGTKQCGGSGWKEVAP